jgi:hypothetical protein
MTAIITPRAMTEPGSITIQIQGFIFAHKQTPNANVTQIRTAGYNRIIEMPDMREAGFKPGDQVTIVITQKAAKS